MKFKIASGLETKITEAFNEKFKPPGTKSYSHEPLSCYFKDENGNVTSERRLIFSLRDWTLVEGKVKQEIEYLSGPTPFKG